MADVNKHYKFVGFFSCSRSILLKVLKIEENAIKPICSRKPEILKGWEELYTAFTDTFPVLLGKSSRWWNRNARGKDMVILKIY